MYIYNTCCSFELYANQILLKKITVFTKI